MTDLEYGDYSRVARMAELRFLGVSSELIVLQRPVDLTVRRPGMACFYHVRKGVLRLFPDESTERHFDVGPGHSIGIDDGTHHRWQSIDPGGKHPLSGMTGAIELYAGHVDRRHTVIQRLLNAVIVMPPEAQPQSAIVRHCVEAMVLEQQRIDPNDKVLRRFSEILQLQMLDYADQRLSEIGPIPSEVRRDAPLLRAWTAFLGDPAHGWTIPELAAVAGISRTALFERCRRAIGKSPAAAMREIRVNYAAAMLRASQAPVAEIAAKVGYGSDLALLRAFRRQLGRTPADWRNTGTPLP